MRVACPITLKMATTQEGVEDARVMAGDEAVAAVDVAVVMATLVVLTAPAALGLPVTHTLSRGRTMHRPTGMRTKTLNFSWIT
jgi:hypothetical protein